MHGELVADDHRQQAGAGAPAWDRVVRRRRPGDGLTAPAVELIPHRLHHLPLARHQLQRLGDVFPELDQIRAAATGSGLGRGQHDALARQVGRQRRSPGPTAGEGTHRRVVVLGGRRGPGLVLGRRRLQLPQFRRRMPMAARKPCSECGFDCMISSTRASVFGPTRLASRRIRSGVQAAWRRCTLGICSDTVVWRRLAGPRM